MDKYIKQSIVSRKKAIFDAYEVGVGEEKKIDALFSEIEKMGSKCKDVGEFETEFAKSPLNQQYLDLFTEIATSAPAKGIDASKMEKPNIGGVAAGGVTEGVVESVVTQAKNAVLPTKAAIHQEAHDVLQKVPILGDAVDISQKAGYIAHLGKLFKKKKPKEDKKKS